MAQALMYNNTMNVEFKDKKLAQVEATSAGKLKLPGGVIGPDIALGRGSHIFGLT